MSLITSNPTIDLVTDQQPSVYYLDDGVAIFKCVAAPEGVVIANIGSLAAQSDGTYWGKVSGDGLATGWQQISLFAMGLGFERLVVADTSSAATVGTGLDNLTSIVIPANTWAVGQRINYVADGNFNGALDTKRLVLNGDAILVMNAASLGINNSNWHLEAQFIRVPAGLLCVARLSFSAFGLTDATIWRGATTFQTPNFANPYTIQVQAECTNGGDSITQGNAIASLL